MGSPLDQRLLQQVASYLDAALNKIEVATYCKGRLATVLESERALRVEVQTFFEGTLYAGVAATDQLAEAANLAFTLGLNNPNLRRSLEALQHARRESPIDKLTTDLSRWRQQQVVVEAGAIRRRATHHYYPKGLRSGEWVYEASDGLDAQQGGNVGHFVDAYVQELTKLKDLIWELASLVGAKAALVETRKD